MSNFTSQILGEYRLERKIEGGGFSTVYLAKHIHLHQQVAIKVLHTQLTSQKGPEAFLQEMRGYQDLKHPHILSPLDIGVENDHPYLVMEYMDHGSLREKYPTGTKLSAPTIITYVNQIASALQYVHDQRIIHRDIKPENILLRADDTILLSDFGIAKPMEQSTLTSVQTLVGTPVYMAPEQLEGGSGSFEDASPFQIVAMEKEAQTYVMHDSRFGKGESLSYETTKTLP
jgi:serine/threonine protein kinase